MTAHTETMAAHTETMRAHTDNGGTHRDIGGTQRQWRHIETVAAHTETVAVHTETVAAHKSSSYGLQGQRNGEDRSTESKACSLFNAVRITQLSLGMKSPRIEELSLYQ